MRVADGYRWQVEQRTLLGNPIDKFSLLGLIAKQYKKPITIDPDDTVVIGRTLDSSRFSLATG